MIACHGLRTLSRFAALFGLAETRGEEDGRRLPDVEVRKTPLLGEFVRFAA